MFLVCGWSNRKVLNDVAARHATPWGPGGRIMSDGIVTMAFLGAIPYYGQQPRKRAFWERGPKTPSVGRRDGVVGLSPCPKSDPHAFTSRPFFFSSTVAIARRSSRVLWPRANRSASMIVRRISNLHNIPDACSWPSHDAME